MGVCYLFSTFFWSFGFLHYIILDAADCTSKFRFIRTIITGDSDHNGHIHVLLLFNTSLKEEFSISLLNIYLEVPDTKLQL